MHAVDHNYTVSNFKFEVCSFEMCRSDTVHRNRRVHVGSILAGGLIVAFFAASPIVKYKNFNRISILEVSSMEVDKFYHDLYKN